MVDIETLGSSTRAQVLQLSGVAFELNGTVREPHELLQAEDRWFDAAVEPYPEGEVDPRTAAWWAAPEQAVALERIRARESEEIVPTLVRFTKFAKLWLGKRGRIWAKPPMFDLRILRGAYETFGLEAPWHYSQEHDLRTLMWIAGKVPTMNFRVPVMGDVGLVRHYALHDAAQQVVAAQTAFRALTLSAVQWAKERRAQAKG